MENLNQKEDELQDEVKAHCAARFHSMADASVVALAGLSNDLCLSTTLTQVLSYVAALVASPQTIVNY